MNLAGRGFDLSAETGKTRRLVVHKTAMIGQQGTIINSD
jgi:hypothetical protein